MTPRPCRVWSGRDGAAGGESGGDHRSRQRDRAGRRRACSPPKAPRSSWPTWWPTAARDTVEHIVADGGRAVAVAADVSDESQVADVVAAATQQLGGLHVLFNNAGIFPGDDGGVLDTPPSTWDRVMNVNLKGLWLCCRGAIPAMIDSGGGSIVNVASFVALMGAATAQVAYTASKGGVLAFTRELAVEYARKGIRANALCPGPIETPLLGRAARRPRTPQPSARAHPHGPPGAARGGGPRRALLGLGRILVHDGLGSRRRRRDHRRLRHSGVARPGADDRACWTRTFLRAMVRSMLDRGELTRRITDGSIDTVVVAFPDMQGRPVGKRVTGRFFLDHVLEHGIEACDYLLAVDVDMEPLPGYRFANWETGYGDVVAVPDLATLRLLPWLEGSAMVVCDVMDTEWCPRRGVAAADPRHDRSNGPESSVSTSAAPPSSSSTCSARPSRRRRHRGGATCIPTCRPSRTTSSCRRRARSTSCDGSATRWWRRASRSSSPRVRRAGASTR